MTPSKSNNPAEQASKIALDKIKECLSSGKSFLLEAGAGAGKTYSLVETLKYLIAYRGDEFLKKGQQVACITYTNVAAEEISSRTDKHPAIFSSTIHAFGWSLIKDFQPFLREKLALLEKWPEKIEEAGGIKKQSITYDLGHRKIDEKEILLHHDDVLSFLVILMEEQKFVELLVTRYPVIFIDEYQDTEVHLTEALKTRFLGGNAPRPLVGFFGDNWQKIYGTGCGRIEHPDLEIIGKEANFRSVPIIVNALNRIRPSLPQQICDPDAQGSIGIFHTNNWVGARRNGGHWGGDLPAEDAHNYLEKLRAQLKNEEWDFSPDKTKILMLTHNVLAEEQGYRNLSGVFSYNDSFIKKEDRHIEFMIDILEPVCLAYVNKLYGKMFLSLGRRTPLMASHEEKEQWAKDMDSLLGLRETGTIGDVIDHLHRTRRPRLPESIENKERHLQEWLQQGAEEREENKSLSVLNNLRVVAYREVIALSNFLNNSTPFNTKHGVKGAEFENVLVVCGRGWNQYNFNQFLEWSKNGPPNGKEDSFERNRNLFYVACSRPKKRLSLLFTQKLSDTALQTLSDWFGSDSIQAL